MLISLAPLHDTHLHSLAFALQDTWQREGPTLLPNVKWRFAIAVLLSLASVYIYFCFGRASTGRTVKFDRPLPEIGSSLKLSVEEDNPPLQLVGGSLPGNADIPGWMEPSRQQLSKDLTFEEYSALCTPQFLAETDVDKKVYDQFLHARAAARAKGTKPAISHLLYVVTASANGTEYIATCITRSDLTESSIDNDRSFQFFRKTNKLWQYDVPSYPANPFSVLPYDDLRKLREMIASGRALVDSDGKLKPIGE